MAYLTKDDYRRREEAAARRNAKNAEKAVAEGMTEEQVELVSDLCSLRHELHCNIRSLVQGNDNGRIARRLVALNQELRLAGLPPMPHIPAYKEEYIDIDTIDEIEADPDAFGEEIPDNGTEEYEIWRDDTCRRIYGEWAELHEGIEGYLANIDKRYGTAYCPAGIQRML